jgi:hypothetical protein
MNFLLQLLILSLPMKAVHGEGLRRGWYENFPEQTKVLSAISTKEIHSYDGDFLYSVYGITVMADGSFFVTDKLDYKVKHIDAKGKLVKEIGRRGRAHGEFLGPGAIAGGRQTLAVADLQSPHVQIFTYDLQFLSEFYAPGPVINLQYDADDNLWIGILTYANTEALFRVTTNGSIVKGIQLKNTTKNPFENLFNFVVRPDGNLRVLFACQNILEQWSREGVYQGQRGIPGFPNKLRWIGQNKSILFSAENGGVPEGVLFFRITSDGDGTLYVLGEDFAREPYRDVFVLDENGELTGMLQLPKTSSLIYVDGQKNLWSVEERRTRVTKYKLLY